MKIFMLGVSNLDQNVFREFEFCFWVWSSLKIQTRFEFGQPSKLINFCGIRTPLTFSRDSGFRGQWIDLPRLPEVSVNFPDILRYQQPKKNKNKKNCSSCRKNAEGHGNILWMIPYILKFVESHQYIYTSISNPEKNLYKRNWKSCGALLCSTWVHMCVWFFGISCFAEGKKREKKKKRVQFAEDVVDPVGNSDEFRRQHNNTVAAATNSDGLDSNSSSKEERERKREVRGMPANRAALYNGILRDRLVHHRLAYSY